MPKTKRFLQPRILILCATALLCVPLLAIAGGGLMGHGFSHRGPDRHDFQAIANRMLDHLAVRLDLTEGQTSELRALVEEHHLQKADQADLMRQAGGDLIRTIVEEPFDELEVRAAVQQAATIAEELAVAHAELFAEARTILTPEQIEELQKMHAEGGPRHHRKLMRWLHRDESATSTGS